MGNEIAQRITRHRRKMRFTQDQMGAHYDVSGPAIFKFEKGYVLPSFQLWLRMAGDMNLDKRAAMMMHIREKLPQEYRMYANWQDFVKEDGATGSDREDFTVHQDGEELRQAVMHNQWLPLGLVEFATTEENWQLYKPTGEEVNILRDFFTPLGEGGGRDFCDALRLVREFQK